MFIRLVGQFRVEDETGRDHTPRGAKARAILALLSQTPGHCRPRRWLEARLWSDRGQEQASGSLRQALTELRKALGPLAGHLKSDRDCVALTDFSTDLLRDPVAARQALCNGRDFLEGIDIIDAAFCQWLAEERQRLAHEVAATVPVLPDRTAGQPFALRLGSLPDGVEPGMARDLAGAIARLAAEYLLGGGLAGHATDGTAVPTEGLDLQIEGAWSEDRVHLKLRLVARSGQKTIWSQRLIASRHDGGEGPGTPPTLVFETSEAPIM